MNFSEARLVVKKHPKRIADFKRDCLPTGTVLSTTKFHWLKYSFNSCTGQTWRKAASIGDGKLYALKFEETEEGVHVIVPNFDKVIWEDPLDGDGIFEMHC